MTPRPVNANKPEAATRRSVSLQKEFADNFGHGEHRQRLRFPRGLPVPKDSYEWDWSDKRPEWARLCPAERLMVVRSLPAFDTHLVPLCEELDRSRGRFLYSSLLMELVLMWGTFAGLPTVKATRQVLADDLHARDREVLGCTADKTWKGGLPRRRRVGVPSERALCYHRKRFPDVERVEAYRLLFAELREQYLATADGEELALIGIDATDVESHYTPETSPRLRYRTVETKDVNGETVKVSQPIVTCVDGGTRDGRDGFKAVIATNSAGLPLAYNIEPIQRNDVPAALPVVEQLRERIWRHLPADTIPVATCDAGFRGPFMRDALRRAGAVDNIQIHSSYTERRSTRQAVEKARRERLRIQGHPDWQANGLRELFCRCGRGTTSKRITKNSDGTIASRIEGRCETCGPIEITAGKWRRAQNPNRYVRMDRRDGLNHMDMFGAPLTYRDKLSQHYRQKRMGHVEGLFGALSSRFGVIRNKGWYRSQVQAEIRLLTAFIGMLGLTVERRRRLAAEPPPIAAAA